MEKLKEKKETIEPVKADKWRNCYFMKDGKSFLGWGEYPSEEEAAKIGESAMFICKTAPRDKEGKRKWVAVRGGRAYKSPTARLGDGSYDYEAHHENRSHFIPLPVKE